MLIEYKTCICYFQARIDQACDFLSKHEIQSAVLPWPRPLPLPLGAVTSPGNDVISDRAVMFIRRLAFYYASNVLLVVFNIALWSYQPDRHEPGQR